MTVAVGVKKQIRSERAVNNAVTAPVAMAPAVTEDLPEAMVVLVAGVVTAATIACRKQARGKQGANAEQAMPWIGAVALALEVAAALAALV